MPRRAKTDPHAGTPQQHDDVWAWVIIGLIALASLLVVWVPLIRVWSQ